MTTAQHTAPLAPYPVARFIKQMPAEYRGNLPRLLSEVVGRDRERRDTIEAALLTIDPFEPPLGLTRDKGWPAKLPHLDAHYADGWKFGYSAYGATHRTLHLYLWKPIPGTGLDLRP